MYIYIHTHTHIYTHIYYMKEEMLKMDFKLQRKGRNG